MTLKVAAAVLWKLLKMSIIIMTFNQDPAQSIRFKKDKRLKRREVAHPLKNILSICEDSTKITNSWNKHCLKSSKRNFRRESSCMLKGGEWCLLGPSLPCKLWTEPGKMRFSLGGLRHYIGYSVFSWFFAFLFGSISISRVSIVY